MGEAEHVADQENHPSYRRVSSGMTLEQLYQTGGPKVPTPDLIRALGEQAAERPLRPLSEAAIAKRLSELTGEDVSRQDIYDRYRTLKPLLDKLGIPHPLRRTDPEFQERLDGELLQALGRTSLWQAAKELDISVTLAKESYQRLQNAGKITDQSSEIRRLRSLKYSEEQIADELGIPKAQVRGALISQGEARHNPPRQRRAYSPPRQHDEMVQFDTQVKAYLLPDSGQRRSESEIVSAIIQERQKDNPLHQEDKRKLSFLVKASLRRIYEQEPSLRPAQRTRPLSPLTKEIRAIIDEDPDLSPSDILAILKEEGFIVLLKQVHNALHRYREELRKTGSDDES